MPLPSGTKLGPYEIQAQLGAGGMGEVYRAHDSRLDRTVAIKVLPASFSSDRDRLQRFAQEARAAAALNHPNILSIFDIGEDRGTPYVVSELLEGETLRDRLRGGSIPIRKASDYSLQVMRGLSAAHDKGIVHRDLKPENLFLTKDGHVKILDFGLAKLTLPTHSESGDAPTIQAATEPGLVMGTVGYMSPEQVRGKPADARSDIFAFGAILYEMIAGKRAFHGDSAADAMSSILKDDPPDLTETNRNVQPALERIVRHCLEKNPEERFQSARDVAFNLEALTDVSATSRSGAVRAIPEAPQVRRWILPVLGTILLLASWAAIYILARRSVHVRNPTFHQITFRRGTIWAARFAPDGQTIVYGASWDGQPQEVFSSRYDSSDSRAVGLPNAQVLAVSSSGELAVSLHPVDSGAFNQTGTLARVPLAGGAPREVLEDVAWADWTPDGQSLAVIRRPRSELPGLELPPGNVIYKPNGWASHVRVSPRGDLVAFEDHVAGGDDGRVVVIDTHGNHKASSSFYGSVQGLAWTPDGKEVWFSAVPRGSARSIYGMDLSSKEHLIYRAPGGLTIQDISRNGLVLMTGDQARMTLTALPPGEAVEHSLSWFDWSLLSSISGDGKVIVFSESGEAVGTDYSIFLRKTDGSPAVRLGNGGFGLLSPDGHSVIALVGAPAKLVLLPTGVGETRDLTDNKTDHFAVAWMPDSKSFVFSTEETGHGRRTFLQSIDGGPPRPITPEGTMGGIVSPDGKYLGAADSKGQRWLYPIAGGEPQKLDIKIPPDEYVMNFTTDGKGLLARTRSLPVRVSRIDLATGRHDPYRVISPADTAGLKSIPSLRFSDDGKSYAYSSYRILSDLFVVDGMK